MTMNFKQVFLTISYSILWLYHNLLNHFPFGRILNCYTHFQINNVLIILKHLTF